MFIKYHTVGFIFKFLETVLIDTVLL